MAVTMMTDTNYDTIFKRVYMKLADNLYASYDNIVSQIKQSFGTIGGKQLEQPIEVTFGGSVGSSLDGTLPDADHADYINAIYTPKRNYARIKIDNLTIKASEKSQWAFVRAIDGETIGKLRSFNRNQARIFFNDGTGILGQFSGNASGTAAAPVVTIITTGNYRRRYAHFERGDLVNVNTLGGVWKITTYNKDTGALTLERKSGSDDLTAIGAGTHNIYMQNSRNADPYGLLGFVANTTHYEVAEQDRYKPPSRIDAQGAPLDTDLLTDLVDTLDTENDETPTILAFSPTQFRNYVKLLEDRKTYPVPVEVRPRPSKMAGPDLIARVGWSGIQYVGANGNVIALKNRFIRDDMVWALNTNYIERRHVDKPKWQDRDGEVFMRMLDRDAYEARYGAYYENIINPYYIGYIENLPSDENA